MRVGPAEGATFCPLTTSRLTKSRAGAVTNIFKLTALHLSGHHGQARVLALQGLHARQLIGAHDPLALGIQARRLAIHRADVLDFVLEIGIPRWGQPIAPAVGLQCPLFRSRAA